MAKIKQTFYLINPASLKLGYFLGLCFIFFSFLPWVNFGTNTRDTQPWPLLFGLLFLLASYKDKYSYKELSIVLLPIFSFFVWFLFSNQVLDFIALRAMTSYLAFTVCFLSFVAFIKKYGFPWKLILSINILYILIALAQLYYPTIVSSIVTTRGLALSGRGVTSLASEPTFFAIFLFFLSYLYLSLSNFNPTKKVSLMIIINILSIFFLSKSSTVILFIILSLPFLLITRLRLKYFFGLSIFSLLIIYVSSILLEDSRLLLLLSQFEEIGLMKLIFMDESINDRVANVIFPLHGFYVNNFLPGGFHSFTSMHSFLTDYYLGLFNYGSGSTSIMSYIGVFIFELGFLGLFFLGWIFLIIQDGSIRRFLDTLLLFILLNSSVPPSLPLIPFIFATFILNNNLKNND